MTDMSSLTSHYGSLGGAQLTTTLPTKLHDTLESVPAALWRDGRPADPAELHCTLKYGLLVTSTTPIEARLAEAGWVPPAAAVIGSYEIFGSPSDPYETIVGVISADLDRFRDANQLLSTLPHVDTFPGYRPHVTLGFAAPGCGRFVMGILGVDANVYTIAFGRLVCYPRAVS